MRFEWDERKSRLNRKKHRISFELAMQVFADPFSRTLPDRTIAGEERFWTLGRIESLLVIVVVHTNRDERGEEVIRIISARRATARERRLYEEDK